MQSLQAICLVRAAHLHGTQSLQWPLRRHPACSAKQQEVTGLPNGMVLIGADQSLLSFLVQQAWEKLQVSVPSWTTAEANLHSILGCSPATA